MTNEEAGTPKPIEYLEPPKRAHRGETYGGTIVIYRLKLLSPQQISEHDLEKYTAPLGGEDNAES